MQINYKLQLGLISTCTHFNLEIYSISAELWFCKVRCHNFKKPGRTVGIFSRLYGHKAGQNVSAFMQMYAGVSVPPTATLLLEHLILILADMHFIFQGNVTQQELIFFLKKAAFFCLHRSQRSNQNILVHLFASDALHQELLWPSQLRYFDMCYY